MNDNDFYNELIWVFYSFNAQQQKKAEQDRKSKAAAEAHAQKLQQQPLPATPANGLVPGPKAPGAPKRPANGGPYAAPYNNHIAAMVAGSPTMQQVCWNLIGKGRIEGLKGQNNPLSSFIS